jgi:hypothetical protein
MRTLFACVVICAAGMVGCAVPKPDPLLCDIQNTSREVDYATAIITLQRSRQELLNGLLLISKSVTPEQAKTLMPYIERADTANREFEEKWHRIEATESK